MTSLMSIYSRATPIVAVIADNAQFLVWFNTPNDKKRGESAHIIKNLI